MASKREPGTPEYVCICCASHVDALCASGLLVLVKCVVVGKPWSTMVLRCTLDGTVGPLPSGTLGLVCYRA